jgi:DNA-binding transcriptional LysR family regulator
MRICISAKIGAEIMDSLKSVDTLLAALETWRTGTPSRAAHVLGIAPSSVYRAIDRLERELGSPLFARTSRGWSPTPAGLEVKRLAEAVEDEVRRTEMALLASRAQLPDAIRITASDSIADYIARRLNPDALDVRGTPIELLVDNLEVDLMKRQADIAIRPIARPGESLHGLRAGRYAHALYGAHTLARRVSSARGVEAVVELPFCALSASLGHFTGARWMHDIARRHRFSIAFIANSELQVARAIEAGVGIGVLPCFLGDGLVGVERLDPPITDDGDIWILTNPALAKNKAVKRLMRALAKLFRGDAARFAGKVGA